MSKSRPTFLVLPSAWPVAGAALAFIAGCAVPQAALDQANDAGNLMMALQAQEAKLQKDESLIAAGRIASIREQRRLIQVYATYSQGDADLAAAAGDTAGADLISKLQNLSDQKAKEQLDLQKSLSDLDNKMSKLLSPVPSTAASAADAQKKIAALGVQRSDKEKFAFISVYAKEIKDGKIPAATPAASAASAAAPHQAAPSPKPPTALKE